MQPHAPLIDHHVAPCPMNSITLVGRVASELETRDVNGTAVTTFRLAVNRNSKEEEPDWFTIEVWGKQSDLAQRLFGRGALVGVIGTLRLMKWTEKDTGEKRSRPLIRSSFFEVLQGRREDAGDAGGGGVEAPVRRQLPQRIERSAPAAAPAAPMTRPADVPF